jgi:hypothetical protein
MIFDFTNFRKRWDAAVELVGLEDFQFRDLRRTGATWLYNKGMKLKAISKYLGHATIAMTERYIGVEADDAVMAGEVMGSIFSGLRKEGETSDGTMRQGSKSDQEQQRIPSDQSLNIETENYPNAGQVL